MTDIEKLEKAARELNVEVGKVNLIRNLVCEKAGVPPGSFGYITGMKFVPWLRSLKLPDTEHEKNGSYMPAEDRKQQILKEAVTQAEQTGYMTLTRSGIADSLGVSYELVKHYYKDHAELLNAVMERAIQTENHEIIVQGIVNKHPIAMDADTELKTEAVRSVLLS